MHRFNIAFLLLLGLTAFAYAQPDYEKNILLQLNVEKGMPQSASPILVPHPSNPLEGIPAGSLLTWYYGIQTQSAQTCNLLPPNAIYGAQAVVTQHVLPGLLNYFDRVQRCHGLNLGQYSSLPGENYDDAVRNFRYQPVFISQPYHYLEKSVVHE